jgi:hypothetical protein
MVAERGGQLHVAAVSQTLKHSALTVDHHYQAAALLQPPSMVAAGLRLLVPCSQAGKPGARKRKLGPAAGSGSMDVLPSNLIMSTGFKPPKVRHLG